MTHTSIYDDLVSALKESLYQMKRMSRIIEHNRLPGGLYDTDAPIVRAEKTLEKVKEKNTMPIIPTEKTLSASIEVCLSILSDAGYATYALISPTNLIEEFYNIYDEEDTKITHSFLERVQDRLRTNYDPDDGINTNTIRNAIMDEYNTVGL